MLRPVLEVENAWIPLKDGTRLAARMWLPSDADRAPVPAVLEYLPYRKDDGTALADAVRHPYFAGRGYAAVRVDMRGTGDSDGLLRGEYLPQEQDDALEVLAWLAAQPWCDGSVGMIGYSWGGFNGLQVAARRPPELKAVVTVASTDDRYLDDCHYMGGCLLGSDMLKWASSMLTYTLQPPDPRFVGDCWRGMWLERLEQAPELARDWITHQLRDDFWRHGSVAEDYGAIQCPVMAVGGWADAYTNAVPRLLEHLTVPRLGIIGPWGHMMPHEGVPGPAIAFLQEVVRWWDRWLKGIDNDVMNEPRMRIWIQEYVTPATFHADRPGRWIGVESWPPPEIASFRLRLGGDGALESEADAQRAPAVAAPREGSMVSITGSQECGETAGVWCANGYADEMAGDQRGDDTLSLCFTTEALDSPMEVLGFPSIRLRVSSDRPWAFVTVRLEDVAPDGHSLLVSWGMLNLTHRESHERSTLLEPGREYEVEVVSRVCGHRFAPGHRIRLALSPTYWPHAWPSPEPAALTLTLDGASFLELPVRQQEADLERPAPVFRPPAVTAVGTGAGGGAPVQRDETGTRRDERRRSVSVDPETGRHQITDREEHVTIIAAAGVRYSEAAVDIYSIVEQDPLSASVRCLRETSSEGGSVPWRVTLSAEMHCDTRAFHLSEEYAAYEGVARLFVKTRTHSMPRDMV